MRRENFQEIRDLNQLIEKSIEAQNIQFAIFHGLSNNRFKRLDITDARELIGYEPQDDATDVNSKLNPLHLSQSLQSHSIKDGTKSGIREDARREEV